MKLDRHFSNSSYYNFKFEFRVIYTTRKHWPRFLLIQKHIWFKNNNLESQKRNEVTMLEKVFLGKMRAFTMCVLMFHSITFNRVMKIKSHVALFLGKFMRAISTGNGLFQA